MILLATDLDRTLFPNGEQLADHGLDQLKAILELNPEIRLAFVSGRNLRLIQQGIAEFDPPMPDYAIGMVGTKVYTQQDGTFAEDTGWVAQVRNLTRNWEIETFQATLAEEDKLRKQEDDFQNKFKLSYYLDDRSMSDELVPRVTKRIQSLCPDAVIVYSVDETRQLGFVDILSKYATKISALEYLRTKLGLSMNNVIYAGDSGNDILPITFGYKAILVRNAIDEVRDEIKSIAAKNGTLNQIYFARGTDDQSGYYASGIVEGLQHFRIA